ncbi:cobalt ECF transporter T component CbiQ [Clostridium cochlearium]|uniref:cobalt ECF transporter T component CbiQ n=1 Tax=Clostridium cochlearium TaxID=1494 RepID=UPI0014597A23|nr:cobalt ECF transporter T component CbiQ [Clostridium cochlearium]NME95585.1 cobalt ECF transporter T component CbiQ [Clostridium cochlearium]
MLKLIMALSKRNKLTYRHPIEKVIISIMPIIMIGFTKNPIIIIGNIIFFAIMHKMAENNMKIVLKFTSHIAVFAAFSSLTFVFDYGIKYVGIILLKSLSAGLCLSFLSLTTPIDQILYLISKNQHLKDMCDIAKSMERFLVLINEEYNIMYLSMKSRGGFGTFSSKIKDTGKLAALLFVNTMERWKSIKEGINSRCYIGYMPYLGEDFILSKKNLILACSYNLFLIISILLFNNGL